MPTLTLVDPCSITNKDCPVFVQSTDMRSFFGFGIRARTKSNWNHSMIMRIAGKLATQSNIYKEIDIQRYMKPGCMMKFWICKDITPFEKNTIVLRINIELCMPWYKKLYDFPGVVGQLFGLRWFNIPFLNYCSERVSTKLSVIIPDIPKHPTPEDIDTIFKNSPRMEVLGYYLG